MKKTIFFSIILLLGIPIIVNFIIGIPSICQIAGDSSSWVSFWGCYIGAIVSAAVAFTVLHKQLEQNHKENQYNNQLQIIIFNQTSLQNRLDELKRRAADFISSFNYIELNYIYEKLINYNYTGEERKNLLCLIRDTDEKRISLELSLQFLSDSEHINRFNYFFNIVYNNYGLLISDGLEVIDLMNSLPDQENEIALKVSSFLQQSESVDHKYSDEFEKIETIVHRSLSDIIVEFGDYGKIKEAMPQLLKIRLRESIDDSAALENMKNALFALIDYEQKLIDDMLNKF